MISFSKNSHVVLLLTLVFSVASGDVLANIKATPENLATFELVSPELTDAEWNDYIAGVIGEMTSAAGDHDIEENASYELNSNPALRVELYQASAAVGKQFILFYEYDVLRYAFVVSAAAVGRSTPGGQFKIIKQRWRHMSGTYPSRGENNMDHASYFRPVYAFHATTFGAYNRLGTRASHGCVRMGRPQARLSFSLIRKHLPNVSFKSFKSGDPKPSDLPKIRKWLADDLNFVQDMLDSRNKGDTPFSMTEYFQYVRGELPSSFIESRMRAKGISKILEVDNDKKRVPESE